MKNKMKNILNLSVCKDTFEVGNKIYCVKKGIIKKCLLDTRSIIGLNMFSGITTEEIAKEMQQNNPKYQSISLNAIIEQLDFLAKKQAEIQSSIYRILKRLFSNTPFELNNFEANLYNKLHKFFEPILKKTKGVISICKVFVDFECSITSQPHIILLFEGGLHIYNLFVGEYFSMDSDINFPYPFECIENTNYDIISLITHLDKYILEKNYKVTIENSSVVWLSEKHGAVSFDTKNDYDNDFIKHFIANGLIQKDIVYSLLGYK